MQRTPTALSQEWLEERGWIIGPTEIPASRSRPFKGDLYGFFDKLAFNSAQVIGVQICEKKRLLEHMRKAQELPKMLKWLMGPGRGIELHGWSERTVEFTNKAGARRKKKVPALERWIAAVWIGELVWTHLDSQGFPVADKIRRRF